MNSAQMKTILLIDDDLSFLKVLENALNKKGFVAITAANAGEALKLCEEYAPGYILLDLKIGDDSGLKLIPEILKKEQHTKIVILTGYASVATAVEAIKLGAVHYLAKPISIEDVIDSFNRIDGNSNLKIAEDAVSLNELEINYIKSVLFRNSNNISASARELKMHRRTLQRKIEKIGL